MSSPLFSPFSLRDLTLKNRIVFSPMLMYLAGNDGRVNDRHFVHYGARALGGTALVMTEVVAVTPRGRISANDLGLWEDSQIEGIRRIGTFVHECGAAFGVQLAHAGRKARLDTQAQAPSALAYADDHAVPESLHETDMARLREAYVQAARRAHERLRSSRRRCV